MVELKTKATAASVSEFLDEIPDERRRKDCADVAKIMKRVTKGLPLREAARGRRRQRVDGVD